MDPGNPATYPLAGRQVGRIGLGTMRLRAIPPDFADAVRLLRRAVELGVDHIDTSDYYGPHVVTQAIRHALHPYPADLVLATKLGWRIDDISNATAAHVRHVRAHADIVTVQNRYNLGATHDDPLIEELARDAIPYVSFFPLHDVPASAAPDVERLRRERGLTAAGAVLALLLERHPNLLLIPGTSSVEHLEENLRAGRA